MKQPLNPFSGQIRLASGIKQRFADGTHGSSFASVFFCYDINQRHKPVLVQAFFPENFVA